MHPLPSRALSVTRRLALAAAASAIVHCTIGCGDNRTSPAGHPGYVAPDAAPLSCVPDLDGVLRAGELPTVYDTPEQFLINPAGSQRPVDVAGVVSSVGVRTWSFGVDFADDQTLTVTVSHVQQKWYAGSFPSGQFVSAQDAGGTIEGVYRRDDAGVYLLGLASATEKPPEGKTLLVYDAPIPVAKLPLAPGASWVAAGTITGGVIRGLPYAGKDTYEVTDDAVGRLVTHSYTFEQVHRLRTAVTVSPSAGKVIARKQVAFFSECIGEVLRATSRDGETNADFTVAAELRRLGL